MKILVNEVDVLQSPHTQKKILIDTMLLCYAHDKANPFHEKAALIIKAAVSGYITAYLCYQNLLEFYSIMTSKKVKKPLTPKEAAELCLLFEKSPSIKKLLPTGAMYTPAFKAADDLSLINGDIFDCILAYTVKGSASTIWTENIQHFKQYEFLKAENPLEWEWREET